MDRKMVGTFRMGTTSSTAMQSLGRGNRTTRADCRCENVVFVFLSRSDPAGCPLDGVHSSNDHCVAVYGSILMRFSTFFQKRSLFQTRYTVLIFVTRRRHNIREIAVKNCEKSKNRRKSLCAQLRIDS